MFMLNLVFIFFFHYNNYKDAKHKFRGPGARNPHRRGPTGTEWADAQEGPVRDPGHEWGIASDGPGGGTPRCL